MFPRRIQSISCRLLPEKVLSTDVSPTRPFVVFPGPFSAGRGATLAGLGLVVSLLPGGLRAAELHPADLNRYGARDQCGLLR